MNIEVLKELGLAEMAFDAGTVLIREGADQKNVYVLISGKVDVRAKGQQLAVMENPGTILGEVALLLGLKPAATFSTLENSSFYVIGDFMEFIRKHPSACVNVAQTLASHLITTVNHLVSRLRAPSSSRESAEESGHEEGARRRSTMYSGLRGLLLHHNAIDAAGGGGGVGVNVEGRGGGDSGGHQGGTGARGQAGGLFQGVGPVWFTRPAHDHV